MYIEEELPFKQDEDTILTPAIFLQAVDLDAIKRLMERGASRYVKRKWIKRGYTQQLSLYGVIHNKTDDKNYYRRIEVLSNTPYTCPIVMYIYDYFERSLPPYAYSIWLYDNKRKAIGLVAKYEQRGRND